MTKRRRDSTILPMERDVPGPVERLIRIIPLLAIWSIILISGYFGWQYLSPNP